MLLTFGKYSTEKIHESLNFVKEKVSASIQLNFNTKPLQKTPQDKNAFEIFELNKASEAR